MHFHLLDAGGAFLLEYLILLFLALATLVEAIVMIIMKFNLAGKCFLDALLVNIASLLAGFFLFRYVERIGGDYGHESRRWLEILVMFLVTMVIEGPLLALLNKQKPARQVWLVTLVMNLVTYLLLIAFFNII